MKRSNRLILLIGLLLAVGAFVAIIVVFQNRGTTSGPAVTTTKVVVARQDIPLGDQITAQRLDYKDIDLTAKTPDMFDDVGKVIGKTSRANILTGAILTQSDFTSAGGQDVTPLIQPGLRAMAVKVDAVSGVGTLIQVGDRVDAIVEVTIKPVIVNQPTGTGSAGQPPTFTELPGDAQPSVKAMLQNLEVLGTLSSVISTTADQAGQAQAGQAQGGGLDAQEVVILGVTPQQAEVLRFAQQQGLSNQQSAGILYNITLVLRSPKDKDAPPVETTGITLKTLVEDYGLLPPDLVEFALPKR